MDPGLIKGIIEAGFAQAGSIVGFIGAGREREAQTKAFNEQERRQALQDQQTLGRAKAAIGASGFKAEGSLGAYLDEMSRVMKEQADWRKSQYATMEQNQADAARSNLIFGLLGGSAGGSVAAGAINSAQSNRGSAPEASPVLTQQAGFGELDQGGYSRSPSPIAEDTYVSWAPRGDFGK